MRDRLRTAIQNLIDGVRRGGRSRLTALLAEIDARVAAEDWQRVSSLAKEGAALARQGRHHGLVSRFARVLEQIGEFEAAVPDRFANERRNYRPPLPLWSGEEIAQRTLLIDAVFDHLGQQIRHARLISEAARRAGKCIVLTEPRLIPLLQRTFAGISAVDRNFAKAALGEADLMTNYWDLAERFANTEEKIRAGFVPLQPDADAAAEFRARYRAGGRALVGFAWRTVNPRRQAPALADWSGPLAGLDAEIVSLQYGDVESDIDLLSRAGTRIVLDRSVDQLIDMDRFAAQVAALDLVVAIDSTIAHTAAALGKRTLVLTDDGPSHWPLCGDRTPWYPAATVVRRRGRAWREVVRDVRMRLDAELPLLQAAHRPGERAPR